MSFPTTVDVMLFTGAGLRGLLGVAALRRGEAEESRAGGEGWRYPAR
jgi:hypothetical protein